MESAKSKKSFKECLIWFGKSYLWVMPLLLAVDILTKLLIQANLGDGTVTIIEGFCYIHVIYNTGSGYNFGGNWPSWVHVLLRAAALVAMAYILYARWKKFSWWLKVAFFFLIPGDLGNLIDHFGRMVSPTSGPYYQGVIDWLRFVSGVQAFNYTCNFADILLTFGAIFLILGTILDDISEKRATKKADSSLPEAEKKELEGIKDTLQEKTEDQNADQKNGQEAKEGKTAKKAAESQPAEPESPNDQGSEKK
jgi:lipoprotein signal peptidase